MPDDASYLLCAEDAAGAFFDAASTCTTEDDECCSGEEEESAASIAELIGGEAEYSPRSDYPDRLRSRSIDPEARAESVAWILKVQEYYGFLPLTAYLAVNYMDRFLSLHRLPQEDGWAMQLLAVTCLSLAAKMEETLVPSLLDLQVDGTCYVFEQRTIRRMELLVLTALNWRLRSVTPFTFIDFFACKVDPRGQHTRYLIARATQMIIAAIHGILQLFVNYVLQYSYNVMLQNAMPQTLSSWITARRHWPPLRCCAPPARCRPSHSSTLGLQSIGALALQRKGSAAATN